MRYDFETVLNRSRESSKWAAMKEKKPQVPEYITPLSVADMEFRNAPEITEGLREYLTEAVLGYPRASEEVYEAVLSWVSRHYRWKAAAEWLVFTPGVVNALFQAVRGFTEPGDGVIVMPPVYYPFYNAVTKNGRVLRTCPLKEENQEYKIDFDKLKQLAKEKSTKLLLLCSPHNPVGRVWSKEELLEVGRICCENQVFVVADEIHCDLIMPGYTFSSFAGLGKEIQENAMICLSPSKTFNLAGLSSSCIFIPDKNRRDIFLKELSKTAQMNRLTSIGFQAVRLAYTKGEAWLSELLAVIWENHLLVKDYLGNFCPDIGVRNLEGTYLQWLDLRKLGWNREEQERRMLEENLFFDEGYLFGDEGDGFERVNLACPKTVLEQSLERLRRAVQNK